MRQSVTIFWIFESTVVLEVGFSSCFSGAPRSRQLAAEPVPDSLDLRRRENNRKHTVAEFMA